MKEAFKTFRRTRCATMQLVWQTRPTAISRGAVIVSSSVLPLAVDRNHMKRRIQQTLYEFFLARPLDEDAIDVIVMVYSRDVDKLIRELEEKLPTLGKI
jgi:ribonuclease P protein component